MTTFFKFQLPTRIYFGNGELAKIQERVQEIAGTTALIVTDMNIVNTEFMEDMQSKLGQSGIKYTIYDGIEPNPTVEHVKAGLEAAETSDCDFVIGIGGGSVLDGAKAIALMMRNKGEIGDYWKNPPENKAVPLIAIPTTAGTSSEITWVSVIKDEANKVKMGINSNKLAPDLAIYDPLLTLGVPSETTANIGMDTLTHAIESYTNNVYNPVAEFAALEAIRLISDNLRTAVANGNNIMAREGMMLATLYAGMAFANTGLGVVHAITAIMGGFFPVSHGVINAILLPPCMKFNLISSIDRYVNIARLMGVNVDQLTKRNAAIEAVREVEVLSQDIGIPHKLSEIGVKEDALKEIAEIAIQHVNIALNPRKPSVNDLLNICKEKI